MLQMISSTGAGLGATRDPVTKLWRDTNGMVVEDFGNADNLMIDTAVIEHGGYPIVRESLFLDLTV
ncbi:MAG TPA: hypothetical protein VGJ20_34825 [Xanthobacteraceae bacterium]